MVLVSPGDRLSLTTHSALRSACAPDSSRFVEPGTLGADRSSRLLNSYGRSRFRRRVSQAPVAVTMTTNRPVTGAERAGTAGARGSPTNS